MFCEQNGTFGLTVWKCQHIGLYIYYGQCKQCQHDISCSWGAWECIYARGCSKIQNFQIHVILSKSSEIWYFVQHLFFTLFRHLCCPMQYINLPVCLFHCWCIPHRWKPRDRPHNHICILPRTEVITLCGKMFSIWAAILDFWPHFTVPTNSNGLLCLGMVLSDSLTLKM